MQFEWDEEKNTINKRNLKTFTIEPGQRLTEEQLKEVEEAMRSPIVFDEDREELSPAMMKAFKSAVIQRNRRKKHEEDLFLTLCPSGKGARPGSLYLILSTQIYLSLGYGLEVWPLSSSWEPKPQPTISIKPFSSYGSRLGGCPHISCRQHSLPVCLSDHLYRVYFTIVCGTFHILSQNQKPS